VVKNDSLLGLARMMTGWLCCCVQLLKCAELLGYFVHADIWHKIVVNNVKTSQSAVSLSVLGAVIRGSEQSQLDPHLADITAVITDPGVCHVAEVHALLNEYSF